ncbi:hypothetical protein BDA96_01G449300 [Sorghum bicolor]|uniref:Uncharacterized protein n=2 Tax=Sorghum bicolor TaxID=4558 RepID=A0A921S4C8_SORBI|nr:hypothetical protein BDA96_01G449300 [Sorghum bicolor]KXG39698.1 hypothetical protein SORBI_3001G422200 [Sorghum bicolor]
MQSPTTHRARVGGRTGTETVREGTHRAGESTPSKAGDGGPATRRKAMALSTARARANVWRGRGHATTRAPQPPNAGRAHIRVPPAVPEPCRGRLMSTPGSGSDQMTGANLPLRRALTPLARLGGSTTPL